MTKTYLAVALSLALTSPGWALPTKPGDLTGPQPWVTATQLPKGEDVAQCAFDGDGDTYYQSEAAAKVDDALVVSLSEPATISRLVVVAGAPDATGLPAGLVCDVSADGNAWSEVGPVVGGHLTATLGAQSAKAIRIRVTQANDQPLTVRELWISSTPGVPRFAYPVEFITDCQAEDLAEWTEQARLECMRWWPFYAELLVGTNYRPARRIGLQIKDMDGVAYTAGQQIVGAAAWFRAHRDDVGALIHESIHAIQAYPKYDPGWLVEGLDDWARWWIYEPVERRPRKGPGGKYTDSYQRTGAFLDWIETHRAPGTMVKVNNALRTDTYNADLWYRWAGGSLDDLWAEYQATFDK